MITYYVGSKLLSLKIEGLNNCYTKQDYVEQLNDQNEFKPNIFLNNSLAKILNVFHASTNSQKHKIRKRLTKSD